MLLTTTRPRAREERGGRPDGPARPVRSVRRVGVLASLIAVVVAGCSDGGGRAADPSTAAATPTASGRSPTTAAAGPSADPAATCVAETLAGLTPEQRLGQLLMVGLDTNAPLEALDELVRESHVGNVIYLGGWNGADRVSRTSAHLQGLVDEDSTGGVALLVAADQEGGVVHQLRGEGFTRPPAATEQAAMDPGDLTAAAATWAAELEAAGVNVNLAPVTDTVPEEIGRANEPIGRWGRQYGSTPEAVSRSATAFLEGMLEGGVQGTVKHFPGLGRIRNNTDFSASGITDEVATADDPFLQPFADGIAAGAGLVMMASARYPKLDAENPAMFSERIVTGLLREQLGFEGVVITDDVNAEALADVPPGDRALRFVAAGGDIVLTGAAADAGEMLATLAAAAADDPAAADRTRAAVERVLTLKERMGLLSCSTTS